MYLCYCYKGWCQAKSLPPEEGMGGEMFDLPLEEVLDVSDGVEPPALPEHVGVLRKQSLVDNPPLVFWLLKVWVRKQEEHLAQLTLPVSTFDQRSQSIFHPWPEEVWEILHGIGSDAGNVSEMSGVVHPQGPDLVPHIVRDLHSDLHPCMVISDHYHHCWIFFHARISNCLECGTVVVIVANDSWKTLTSMIIPQFISETSYVLLYWDFLKLRKTFERCFWPRLALLIDEINWFLDLRKFNFWIAVMNLQIFLVLF